MLLELRDVHVHYGKVEAIKGISFTVDEGEIVTLIGGNGAGKTTTLKTISGVRALSAGQVLFAGDDLADVPAHRRVEIGISQAPEGRAIFPGMTVTENLEMGAYRGEARSTTISTVCSSCSPGSRNAATSPAARCRAANSRCWPSDVR